MVAEIFINNSKNKNIKENNMMYLEFSETTFSLDNPLKLWSNSVGDYSTILGKKN